MGTLEIVAPSPRNNNPKISGYFSIGLKFLSVFCSCITCCCVVVVVSGLQAVCHARIMRRWSSNLRQWTIQRPRLWVPIPYSLSPTRRSKPAFQWQVKNERIHRQWQQGTRRTQDKHGGHQFTYGSLVTSLVTGGKCYFHNSPEKLLPSSVGIRYCAWA